MTLTPANVKDIATAKPIRFVSGKYVGKQGWIDPTRKADNTVTPIIINLAKSGGLYQTFVWNTSYRVIETDTPMSYAQAVFLVPDVEASIVSAARKIAMFDIHKDTNGLEGFKDCFGNELEHAVNLQEGKGPKAKWRRVTNWGGAAAQFKEEDHSIHNI